MNNNVQHAKTLTTTMRAIAEWHASGRGNTSQQTHDTGVAKVHAEAEDVAMLVFLLFS